MFCLHELPSCSNSNKFLTYYHICKLNTSNNLLVLLTARQYLFYLSIFCCGVIQLSKNNLSNESFSVKLKPLIQAVNRQTPKN